MNCQSIYKLLLSFFLSSSLFFVSSCCSLFFNCNDFSYRIIIGCQRSRHVKHLLFVLFLVAVVVVVVVVVVVDFCVCFFFVFCFFYQQSRESNKFDPCHRDWYFLFSIVLRPSQFIYESIRC